MNGPVFRNDLSDFLTLAYPERQFIAFPRNQLVFSATETKKASPLTLLAKKNKKVIIAVVICIFMFYVIYASIFYHGMLFFVLFMAIIMAWAMALANRANFLSKQRALHVVFFSKSAAQFLSFLPGHPLDNILYIAHPTMVGVYYPAEHFHRKVFEHKFAEIINLLMSLGASEITVMHKSGWSREFASFLSIPLSGPNAQIVKLDRSDKHTRSVLFKAKFDWPDVIRPSKPMGMVWFSHEPMWQNVANGRLEHGLRNFELTLNYEDDFGVNASLQANLKALNLQIGRKVENHQKTVWLIEGAFR